MGKIRKELEDLAFPFVYPASRARQRVANFSKNAPVLERERKTLQKS